MPFTQGPWKVVKTGNRVEILSDFSSNPQSTRADVAIAHVHSNGRMNGRSYRLPVEDNARLLVLAPEMLEALRDIVDADGEELEHAIIRANEVIEKAEKAA